MTKGKSNTSIGPMSRKSANVPHYIPPRIQLDPPTRITNAGSREPLNLAALWNSAKRPGSEVAFSLSSKGLAC